MDRAYVENVTEGHDFEGITETLLDVSAKYNPVRDVLVSKSYVDSKIKELKTQLGLQ